MATSEELAYLAGVFDGEGSIVIGKAHLHRLTKRKQRYFQVQMHVSMQNRKAIDLFAEVFGGRVTVGAGFTWRIAWSTAKAGTVLAVLLPYLRVKRPQARLALTFQRLRKNPGRRGYTEKEAARDLRMHVAMSTLNHRDSLLVRKALKQQASFA